MVNLIAVLTTGKGTWGHVNGLINGQQWDKVYLVTNDFGKENFKSDGKTELIVIDTNADVNEIRDVIFDTLKSKIKNEVAINFISGSGKEHMALIGAIIKLGIGFRLVISSMNEGIKEV